MPHDLPHQAAASACAPIALLCIRCGARERWRNGAISRCKTCLMQLGQVLADSFGMSAPAIAQGAGDAA
jgi:hypothetical protein